MNPPHVEQKDVQLGLIINIEALYMINCKAGWLDLRLRVQHLSNQPLAQVQVVLCLLFRKSWRDPDALRPFARLALDCTQLEVPKSHRG